VVEGGFHFVLGVNPKEKEFQRPKRRNSWPFL